MSTTIKIKCIDQTLTFESTPTVASGGKNEDYIEFEFCSKWDGYTDKTAVFYRNKEKVYYSLIDESNTCVIPYEVLTTEGTIYLGVFGVKDDVTRTSEILAFKIVKGAITDGLLPSKPSQDIYEQILAEVTSARNLANSTNEAEKAFEKAITKQQNDYETNVTNQWSTYKKDLTKQQDDYETSMNTAWGKYKTDLTKQQNDYEKDLSGQWTTYKTDLTNQQTTFETSTTEKLNTYESNVENIAEESANNAINKASQSITITLSTTWDYDSTNKYYTQSVLVTGIKATDKPVLGIDDSVDNAEEANSEWSKVFHAETYDGGIKFYAKSATTKNLTVLVKPDLSKVTINNVSSEEFAKQVIVNAIYPVGSIYMSVNDVSPSNLFGGTWEKIKDKFLLASGDSYSLGDTGGEAKHTLTVDEMPSHEHSSSIKYANGSETTKSDYFKGTVGEYNVGWRFVKDCFTYISPKGGNQPHNNLPPYLVISVWKRTA